jgi:putative Mg2+ transporter-C (MgtC) family protein
MRTHALVAVGAALFTWIGAYGFDPDLNPRRLGVDPARVAAQVVSGIGFIGAGAILRDRGTVRGVTTAAALWTSAALGLAAGAGAYAAAAAGVVVVLLALVGMRTLRARVLTPLVPGVHTVEIVYARGEGTLAPILEAVRQAGTTLNDIQLADEANHRRVVLMLRTRKPRALQHELEILARRPEIASVETFGLDDQS